MEELSRDVSEIKRFVRTPEGKGVGIVYQDAHVDILRLNPRVQGLERVDEHNGADFAAILNGGKPILISYGQPFFNSLWRKTGNDYATYNKITSILTFHAEPEQTLALPLLVSLFTIPTQYNHETIIGITADKAIVQICVIDNTLSLVSVDQLPLPTLPWKILAVDPMAWTSAHTWVEHDVLLSVSQEGELSFWIPDESKHRHQAVAVSSGQNGRSGPSWRCTGKVKSGRQNLVTARCSSARKTALSESSPFCRL